MGFKVQGKERRGKGKKRERERKKEEMEGRKERGKKQGKEGRKENLQFNGGKVKVKIFAKSSDPQIWWNPLRWVVTAAHPEVRTGWDLCGSYKLLG